MQLLLKHNIDKDIRSKDGIPVLEAIIVNNSISILKAFLDNGFNVNVEDQEIMALLSSRSWMNFQPAINHSSFADSSKDRV